MTQRGGVETCIATDNNREGPSASAASRCPVDQVAEAACSPLRGDPMGRLVEIGAIAQPHLLRERLRTIPVRQRTDDQQTAHFGLRGHPSLLHGLMRDPRSSGLRTQKLSDEPLHVVGVSGGDGDDDLAHSVSGAVVSLDLSRVGVVGPGAPPRAGDVLVDHVVD